jgi:hypothetical protein
VVWVLTRRDAGRGLFRQHVDPRKARAPLITHVARGRPLRRAISLKFLQGMKPYGTGYPREHTQTSIARVTHQACVSGLTG